jgi:hypothetical protein
MSAKPASFFYPFITSGCYVQAATNQAHKQMCSLAHGNKRTELGSLRNALLFKAEAQPATAIIPHSHLLDGETILSSTVCRT